MLHQLLKFVGTTSIDYNVIPDPSDHSPSPSQQHPP